MAGILFLLLPNWKLEKKPSQHNARRISRNKKEAKYRMNLKELKSKAAEIDNIIPRNRWIEIPTDKKYWKYFEFKGLYAIYNKNKIIYIGLSTNIYLRLKSHIHWNGEFRGEENVTKIKIKISPLKTFLLEHIETTLISKLHPKHNKRIVPKNILAIQRNYRYELKAK